MFAGDFAIFRLGSSMARLVAIKEILNLWIDTYFLIFMMSLFKENSELLDAVNASKIYFSSYKNKENPTTHENF